MAVGVVIPAHNEERTIGPLLEGLGDLAADAHVPIEVVVVCNGCTDETAAAARRAAPWAVVDELPEASKPAALRRGDATIGAYPRLYLDADVQLEADAVRRLAAALDGGAEAVAPTPRYDTSGARWLLRSHYRVWTELQAGSKLIAGTGAMMVTAAGRSRFTDWPDLIADDYFLDGLFGPDEKRRLPDVEVVVTLPRTLWGCVSRRARVQQGNREVVRAGLRRADDRSPAGRRLLQVVRARPALLPHLPGHLVVTVAARLLSAWRRRRGSAEHFYRDASSRRTVP